MTENTDNHLIEQQLRKWQQELPAAVSILRGKYLAEFQQLIADVANQCKLRMTQTGTFTKPGPEEL